MTEAGCVALNPTSMTETGLLSSWGDRLGLSMVNSGKCAGKRAGALTGSLSRRDSVS